MLPESEKHTVCNACKLAKPNSEFDGDAKYQELIMAVARKFPNESRHETALRYIMEAENYTSGKIGCQANPPIIDKG